MKQKFSSSQAVIPSLRMRRRVNLTVSILLVYSSLSISLTYSQDRKESSSAASGGYSIFHETMAAKAIEVYVKNK